MVCSALDDIDMSSSHQACLLGLSRKLIGNRWDQTEWTKHTATLRRLVQSKDEVRKEVGAKGKEDTHRCANCNAPGAKMKCGRCGVERYCDQDCQKVRWPSG